MSVGGDALVKPEVRENLRGASPIPIAGGDDGGVPPIPFISGGALRTPAALLSYHQWYFGVPPIGCG